MRTHRFERGQALVLIVLAIVAMFGFAALAVDIGRLFAERRRIQNAADSAALAAVFAASQNDDFVAAALTQLGLNDVFDNDPNRNADQRVDVEIYHPPASGAYGPDSGRPEEERNQYYQVIIHSAVNQVFSQFVYQGPLTVTVEAVGRLRTARSLFAGDVLHATSPTACQGIKFAGTGDTHLIGGDAYSDSTRGSSCPNSTGGGASCTSASLLGNGEVWIEGGTIITSGDWDVNGSGTLITDTPPETCALPKDQPFVPEPNCGDDNPANYRSYSGGNATLQPGIYTNQIKVTGKKTKVQLAPGLYCLDGGLSVTGGNFTGDGVFFYIRGGSFDTVGDAYINLKKGSVEDAIGDHYWDGFLIYMPYENDGEIHLGGGSTSEYSGTIYAPGPRPTEGQDKCIMEGNGTSLGLQSNVICYTIKIVGKANVTIDYQEDQNHQMPPFIELAQ